ncbi:DUF3618 domain-containing protein [Methylobacterium durans]|uniref:DUF3618 domain-containing protein n=1 Tax=Methylobacterium durans TaxID=2202825 RepID=UPI002AFFE484|nr:DUF3618 domain-containing protein [Methylobacterium durans]MEA1830548.1 DUF3618 domain-containing protein [Methylobacterium durans]
MNELEREIEESRARLDTTIDRIQNRLSPSSLVDEMLGSARKTPLNGVYEGALDAVRRNPVPVMLIAAGLGWLLFRMQDDAARSGRLRRARRSAERVPVLNTGAARVYDPDLPAGRPARELAEETQI